MIGKNEAVITAIKKAGFSHIKLELEGHLNRRGMNKYGNETYCHEIIMSAINRESRNKIVYSRFYVDGSVDSELTFTIAVEDIDVAVEVIGAWNELVRRIGNGCAVAGAGMHFSVLTGPGYPSQTRLDPMKLENFRTEVTKLLPALFIGATSGNFTRPLTYRYPDISHETKRSAIFTHRGTCLEYRLFETCYDRPDAVYEFLGVIARTLEFYANPNKKVSPLNKQFNIYQDTGLDGFIKLPEQVSILKAQFKHLRPNGMTIREFMQVRGIGLSVSEAKKREAVNILRLKKMYLEHRTAQTRLREKPFDQYQLDNLEYYQTQEPGRDQDYYWTKVTGVRLQPLEDEQTYINNNLRTDRPLATLNV